MKKTILTVAAALAVSGAVLADKLLINGAGATFPFPLYSKWFSQYNKLHPDIQINYQSIGSGGGIKQITERTVDFGASDAPLTDEQLQKASGVQHIPTVMGAVVIVWNVPGVQQLRIAPETLAAIYLGKVTKWNDAALKNDNPTAKLPDTAITVAHRSDGSGTTNIFTDYLSKVSPDWKSGPGKGTSVNWPAGLGGKGNEGVTGLVKQTEGAVGYVELAYANQNKLPTAELKSHDGQWVKASLESVSAAAVLGDEPIPHAAKGSALLNFIWWAVHDGQKEAAALDYAPLPKPVVEKVEQTLKRMTVNGKPVLASSK